MRIISTQTSKPAEILKIAAKVLIDGGLVIFPTETTYGAGVIATNPTAVDKLLKYKARREGKPMSIAVTDMTMAEKYVELNDSARRLYERFLPGPVTVVSKSLGTVAEGVASEFGTLGVRIPAYPLVLDLVKTIGQPITATSANGSGEKRPYTVKDILDNLSDHQKSLIDLIIDAGPLPPNPPSTVIDTTLSTPVTLRQGEVEATAKTDVLNLISDSETETKQIASRVLLKNWETIKNTGLVIGLDGPLGAGKTIFAKGAAEFLQIHETIVSPTYTYIMSYDFVRHNIPGQLQHLDLWKIDTAEALEKLELAKLLGPNQVIIIEWWSQVSQWLLPLIKETKLPLVTISIAQQNEQRQLAITGLEK